MTTAAAPGYTLSVEVDDGDELKHYLQGVLNRYHEVAYPLMEIPKSRTSAIRVTDERGQVVGGAQMCAYWGWTDVSLLALEPEVPGRGLGRQLMSAIEDKAREQGCNRIRVETLERVGILSKDGIPDRRALGGLSRGVQLLLAAQRPFVAKCAGQSHLISPGGLTPWCPAKNCGICD